MSGVLVWRGRCPERGLDAGLRVEAGRTLALVGPNGAGKSTTLDLIAGLLTVPGPGQYLAIGDDVLVDEHRSTPPHRRRLAVLGQDPLLFPHLRVRANVEFGLRAQGVPRAQARRRADHLLTQVDAAQFAARFPDQLSGGQAARVALARALAMRPRAVLLDEPFAALDVDVAPQMRRMLAQELSALSVPVVLVTHDLLDVLALADDLAVIEDGRIVESAPTAEVLRAPTSAFGAALAGVDHVRGRIEDGGLRTDTGLLVRGVRDAALTTGAAAVAVWSPAAVAIYPDPPAGSPRNVWPGVVADLTDRGGVVRVGVDLAAGGRIGADLSPGAVADLRLAAGTPIHAVVKAQEIRLHPARTESPRA